MSGDFSVWIVATCVIGDLSVRIVLPVCDGFVCQNRCYLCDGFVCQDRCYLCVIDLSVRIVVTCVIDLSVRIIATFV